MNTTELDALISQRDRAAAMAHDGDPEKRPALLELLRRLDEEIFTGKQEVRQQAVEAEVKRKLRTGFAGSDEAFEQVWLANKDRLLFEQMQSASAQAERDARAELQRQVGGN